MFIDLLQPTDSRVRRFLDAFFEGTFPQLMIVGATLFGGDRIFDVDVVAMLVVNGIDIGIATLAPMDEIGEGKPSILALWIDSEAKSMPNYRNLSLSLFRSLVEESVKRYGTVPRFAPATQTELQVAQWAQEEGISFTLVPVHGQLPNW